MISRINVRNNGESKIINIKLKNGCESIIHINKYNQIIYFENNNQIEEVNDLLDYSNSIKKLILRNVRIIGNRFGENNKSLEYISLDNTEIVEDSVLSDNIELKVFIAPQLRNIGEDCLINNISLEYIDISNVEKIGHSFLTNNNLLKEINLPNLKKIGKYILFNNQFINIIDYVSDSSYSNYLY